MRARKELYLLTVIFFAMPAGAQERSRSAKIVKEAVSCNEFAPPAKQLFGQTVGIEQCQITSEETVFNIKGQKFRRVEVL